MIAISSALLGILLLLSACGGDKVGIAIGPPASGTNTLSKYIFEAYDIEEDDYKEYQEGFGDAADGIQDGNIDMSLGILGLPAGNIVRLQASVGDVNMIEFYDYANDYIVTQDH